MTESVYVIRQIPQSNLGRHPRQADAPQDQTAGFSWGVGSELANAFCGDGFSWGEVGTSTRNGAVAGAIGGSIAAAFTGDPTALGAVVSIGSAAGGGFLGGFGLGLWDNRPGPSYPPADPSDITFEFPPSPFPPNDDSDGGKSS